MTDDDVLLLVDVLDRARALALGPAYAIHLRGRLAGARMLRLADELRAITRASGTAFLVHDRADIAALSGADGVHLPGPGLPTEGARRLLPPGRLVGRSTHTPAEAREACTRGADYAFLGNIWETASHPGRPGLGPGALTAAHPARVIAIGGITPATAAEAAAAGAAGVAALRGLWYAPDPAAAARALRVCFPQ